MVEDVLSERERMVLQALVEAYIEIGTPIGSQALGQREGWELSPATIRNTLASLEDKGYVSQPHTSAGRVPTARGYRHYVSQCLEEGGFESEVEEEIRLREQLETQLREGTYEEILSQLAQIIGDITHQLGVVLAPRFEGGIFHHLELVKLSETRLLLVVTIRQGLVKSLVLEVDSRVSQDELEQLSRLLNERLYGLTMAEIHDSVRERLSEVRTGNPRLLQAVAQEIEEIASPSAATLYVAGTRYLCLQPEFHDPRKVAALMEVVEKKEPLAHLLRGRKGVVITIGLENVPQIMRLCSMVTASYEIDGILGVIGVIGPMRMPYGRMVNLVNCVASRVTSLGI